MPLGPIELIVVDFPGSQFKGEIIPELRSLVDRGIIRIADALLIRKDDNGDVAMLEVADAGDDSLGGLGELLGDMTELLSDEDVEEIAAGLAPGDSAAMLVFEHTWAIGFRDAVVNAGGQLVANIRIPAAVVEEVLAAVAAEQD